MGLGTLREKQLVKIASRIFRLETLLSNGQWCMTELGTGLVDQMSEEWLWAAVETGTLKFLDGQSAVSKEVADVLGRLSIAASAGPSTHVNEDKSGADGSIRALYIEAVKGKTRAEAAKAIIPVWEKHQWPKLPPGVSSVLRWKTQANGMVNPALALRSKHAKKGWHGSHVNSEVETILREVRDNHYLVQNPRISLATAVEKVRDRVRVANAASPNAERLRLPGRKAFLAILGEVEAEEILAARFGSDKAMAMLRVSLGGVKVTRPLERVEMDHTVLSIILLDDDFEVVGRAFITAAKDAFTRSIVGFYWGAENPSVVSLARCIRHSVLPKAEYLKGYPDVKNDWCCFGSAESWVIDNGMEEWAAALQQAAAEGGVQKVEFCGRKRPWQKPNIERFFRTQDQALIHNLPGTTMENISKRCNFNPKKDMLIRWSTFDRLIVKWIVDVYMQKPQKILKNRSPHKAWNDSKGSFTQYVPSTTTILECLFLRQVDDRTLDHEGIEFDCLIYNSVDMKLIRAKLGAKLKVNIRVNDEDLGYIYVGVPGYDIWVKVPCLDQEYADGLTRWQHRKCKKMQKACADDGEELTLAEARLQIDKDVESEKAEVTQGRRRARARMKERAKQTKNPTTPDSSPVNNTDPMHMDIAESEEAQDQVEVPDLDVEFFKKDAI